MAQDRDRAVDCQDTDTKKYLPGFSVEPSSTEDRAQHRPPYNGYRITAIGCGSNNDGPHVDDILVSINGRSVGLGPEDDAFGDVTWFLSKGAKIDLVVHRYPTANTKTYTTHNFRQQVEPVPDTTEHTFLSSAPHVLFVPSLD